MTSFYPPTTLVVVDPTVRDYQSLVNCVCPNTEVIVLDENQDGVEQITQVLENYSSLTSLHILSHGQPGELRLGNARLNIATLERYADRLKRWTQAIVHHADILLYGCSVAAGAIGRNFVQRLSTLVRANIAASTNLTGSQALGGDWLLEFNTGTINAPLAFSPAAMAAYPHTLTVFLNETFTGASVNQNAWLFGVDDRTDPTELDPFLTASPTVAAPAGGLPGNPATPPYPAIDPVGGGTLRLTNALNDQAAYVLYNRPFSSAAGLRISFDFFAYGGGNANGLNADGLSFFLVDATDPNNIPTRAGAFGGSLGYAQRNTPTPVSGITGGYVGIGFDEYGNYSNNTEGRNGGPGFSPDSVAVRGSAEGGYAYLAGSAVPFSIDAPNVTNREAARRNAEITLTPDGILTVVVRADLNGNGIFEDNGSAGDEIVTPISGLNVAAANGDTALPDLFTLGFAGSTGDFTNIHEVRNLVVETPGNEPPETLDANIALNPSATVNLTGLSGFDITPPPGTVDGYRILSLPPATQGTLFLGNPDQGGVALTPAFIAANLLTPAQITQLYFRATPGFTGTVFNYAAVDNLGAQDLTPATVYLNVTGNQPPIANDFGVVVTRGTPNPLPDFPVSDPDGTIASVVIPTLPAASQGQLFVGNPNQGGRPLVAGEALTQAQANDLVFVPTPGFINSSFTYFAFDNRGAISRTATVSLGLDPLNQPPTAGNVTAPFTPGTNAAIPALPVADPDGTIASVIVATLPPAAQGTLYLGDPAQGGTPVTLGQFLTQAQAGQLFFAPAAGFAGTSSFTYFATDNLGERSNVATVTIGGSNQLPTAGDVTVGVPPGVGALIPALPVADPDGTIASVIVATLPPAAQGTLYLGDPAQGGTPVTLGQFLTQAQAGQLFFAPAAGFTGSSSFTYFATDNIGALSNVATVTLNVGSNQLPTAGDVAVENVDPGETTLVPALPVADPDGTIASVIIATLPPEAQGTLYLGDPAQGGTPVTLGQFLTQAQAGQLVFVPAAGFTGSSFTYFATDNTGALSNVATVSLSSGDVQDEPCAPGIRERFNNSPNRERGTSGTDTLFGRGGSDTLRGAGCNDSLDGGRSNDSLLGGNARDYLLGRQNNDRLFGENGNDTIIGGTGRDRSDGGRGNDRIRGDRGNDTMLGRGGNDTVVGGRDRDRIFGGANQDFLYGRQRRDFIRGGSGSDRINGNIDRDRLDGERGSDAVYGGVGRDTLYGRGGRDVISGQNGNDVITGGSQADLLLGLNGSDTITSGGGADTISGGNGRDRYIYRDSNHRGDVLVGFQRSDVIDLRRLFSGSEYGRSSSTYIRQVQSGADTVVRIDANGDRAGGFVNFITIQNVQVDSVAARNFAI